MASNLPRLREGIVLPCSHCFLSDRQRAALISANAASRLSCRYPSSDRTRRRSLMSVRKSTLMTAGAAALGFAIGASGYALAFSELGMPMYMKGADTVAELGNYEGVYVDKSTFKLRIGAAKTAGDPMEQITKMGGKEVANGAIIVRAGGKLFLVDGKPAN